MGGRVELVDATLALVDAAIEGDARLGTLLGAAVAEGWPVFPEALAALREIPVLALYGEFIDQDGRWPAIRQRGLDFYARLRAAGGSVEVVALPERGIMGNSHMMMMDRNNRAVAQVVQDWLAARGLWR